MGIESVGGGGGAELADPKGAAPWGLLHRVRTVDADPWEPICGLRVERSRFEWASPSGADLIGPIKVG